MHSKRREKIAMMHNEDLEASFVINNHTDHSLSQGVKYVLSNSFCFCENGAQKLFYHHNEPTVPNIFIWYMAHDFTINWKQPSFTSIPSRIVN